MKVLVALTVLSTALLTNPVSANTKRVMICDKFLGIIVTRCYYINKPVEKPAPKPTAKPALTEDERAIICYRYGLGGRRDDRCKGHGRRK